MPAMRLPSLNTQIVLGASAGIGLGYAFRLTPDSHFSGNGLFVCGLIGGLFVDLLKMVLIPLIFTSIATGIANLRAHASMHRVWQCTLVYFLTATALATLLGLLSANIFSPGAGIEVTLFQQSMEHFDPSHLSLGEFFTHLLRGLFMNPVAAMAQGEVLPTVMFALLVGIGFVVSGENARHLLTLFTELLHIVMLLVGWIMKLAPLGILGLLAKLTATQNPALFTGLGKFIAVVVGSTLTHGIIVLPLLLYLVTGVGPRRFFRGSREALTTALATCSSSATLPITMRCTETQLGVSKDIARFVPPLGTTLNMDGTALYEAAAALFVADLTGAELSLAQQVVVCFTAIIASIGAPGIPSAGMVTMVMVLQSVGLPAEAVAILLPIDRLLDTVRTMVNVEGDMIGSLIVQRLAANPDKNTS